VSGEAPAPGDGWIRVANEFTTARVRKVLTRNGERLEIHSPKLGTTILLDPLELESLTWQTTETFSRMLEDPYGPEDVQPRALSELMSDRDDVSFDPEG
jgi:hypothetical protein